MKLTQAPDRALNVVRSYGNGSVHVGEQLLQRPFLLAAQSVVADWSAHEAATLQPLHLERIWALQPQVVLIGSAGAPRFPSSEIRRAFRERGIAMEAMELGAACRTYNVLVQEERAVVAALFP